MSRDDCIWLAIRVLGLVFLYNVVAVVPGLLGLLGVWLATVSTSQNHPEAGDLVVSIFVEAMKSRAFSAPVELLLYSAGAWYFLKGAPLITRFISKHARVGTAA